ncbi:MAG TPA: bifunctional DNA primase/polymerase [Gemmataceae bacterium]|nr:bifunctional DNA primase/polymerase [Gemmataceae bacterium]
MSRSSCLDAALEYLARGWCAIPLCPPDHAGCSEEHVAHCPNAGAEPVIPWQTYRERLPRPMELQLFWTRYPQCNVGVVLGRVSKLVAVDLEGPEADDLLAQLLPGPLPPTLTLRTPAGERRLFFAIPPTLVVPRGRFDGPGCHVVVLGEGTYAALPPSVHLNGAIYSWNSSSPPPCPTGSPAG